MSRRRCTLGIVLIAAALAACGSEDVARRYEAERFLWRADQDRALLPGRALADGGEAWRAHAERYRTIAKTYETWARDAPAGDFRREILDVAARAWWGALDLAVGVADSQALRRDLDHLVGAELYPDPVVVAALRRRADVAATTGDHERRAADLRALWARVRNVPAEAARHIGIPAEIAAAHRAPDGREEARAWAIQEYGVRTRSAVDGLRLRAQLEVAAMHASAGDFGAVHTALDADLRRLLGTLRPSGDEIRFVVRATEILIEEVAAGAASAADLRRALAFIVDKSVETGRVHYALAEALARNGDTAGALDVLRLIRRRYDDAVWGPRATRAEARLYAETGRWQQAEISIDLLRTRYSLTADALEAPLDVIRRLYAADEAVRAAEMLEETIASYRSLRERYPRGRHTNDLIVCLADALELRGDTDEAFALRLTWVEAARGHAAELERLVQAIHIGRRMLRPHEDVQPLVDRVLTVFPDTAAAHAFGASGG